MKLKVVCQLPSMTLCSESNNIKAGDASGIIALRTFRFEVKLGVFCC